MSYSHYDNNNNKLSLNREIEIIYQKTDIVDEYWEDRVDSLKRLTDLMHNYDCNIFTNKICKLKDNIIIQLKDLRSSVIKEICLILINLSRYLQNNFQWMFEKLLESLLKLLSTSKVIVKYSNNCICEILKNTCSLRCIQIIFEYTNHKSNSLRYYCFSYIQQIVKNSLYKQYIDKIRKSLLRILKSGLQDASAPIRTLSYNFYWDLYSLYTSETLQVFESLPIRKQKTILSSKPLDISNINEEQDKKQKISSNLSLNHKNSSLRIRKSILSNQTLVQSSITPNKSQQQSSIMKDISNKKSNSRLLFTNSKPITFNSTSKNDNLKIKHKEQDSFHYRINKRSINHHSKNNKDKIIQKNHKDILSNRIEPKDNDLPVPNQVLILDIKNKNDNITQSQQEKEILSTPKDIQSPLSFTISRKKRLSAPRSPPLTSPPPVSTSFALFSPAQTPPNCIPRRRKRRSSASLSPTFINQQKINNEKKQDNINDKEENIEYIPIDFTNINNIINEILSCYSKSYNDQLNAIKQLNNYWESICISDNIHYSKDDEIKLLQPLYNIMYYIQVSKHPQVLKESIFCLRKALYCFSSFKEWIDNYNNTIDNNNNTNNNNKTTSISNLCFWSNILLFIIHEPSLKYSSSLSLSLSMLIEEFIQQFCFIYSENDFLLYILNIFTKLCYIINNTNESYTNNESIKKIIEGCFISLQKLNIWNNYSITKKQFKIIISMLYIYNISFICNNNSNNIDHFSYIYFKHYPLYFSKYYYYNLNNNNKQWEKYLQNINISLLLQDECSLISNINNLNNNKYSQSLHILLYNSYTPLSVQQLGNLSIKQYDEYLKCFKDILSLYNDNNNNDNDNNDNIWNTFIELENSRLFTFLLPFIEFEECQISNNRILCYRLNELRLHGLYLYKILLKYKYIGFNNNYECINILFNIFSSTYHNIIQDNVIECFNIIINNIICNNDNISSYIINIFNSCINNNNFLNIQHYLIFLIKYIKKQNNNIPEWIYLFIKSKDIIKLLHDISIIEVKFQLYKFYKSIYEYNNEKFIKLLLNNNNLTIFQKSLLYHYLNIK